MNKAFTANINDQVTARGYLDENNQLIMLEPDMSGGGDFVDIVNEELTFTYVTDEYPYAVCSGISTFTIEPSYVYVIEVDSGKLATIGYSRNDETLTRGAELTQITYENSNFDLPDISDMTNGSITIYANAESGSETDLALKSWAESGLHTVVIKKVAI